MKTKLTLILLTALALAGATGCAAGKATSPTQAIEKLQSALRESDQDAFVACFDANADQQRGLAAMCQLLVTSRQMNEKLIIAYGQRFAAELAWRYEFDALLAAKLEHVTITQAGETALAAFPASNVQLHLVANDDAWLISTEGLPVDFDATARTEEMTAVMESFIDRIGELPAEQFAERFTAQMALVTETLAY